MATLKALQAKTLKAAGDARATGQLTKSAFNAMTDGKVTKADVTKAENVLSKAEALLNELAGEGASSRQLGLAEREVKIADKLLGSVTDQLDAQERETGRPSTGGGKGAARTRRRQPRRTVHRPTTGGGKGRTVSRPSTSSVKGRPGAK